MQSTKVPNHIDSRSNEQVISIPENDLRVEFAELSRTNGFDAALGSYRQERWLFDQAMSSFEPPRARFCAFIRRSYFKHLPNLVNDRSRCKQSIVSPENTFALVGLLLDCPFARFCLGNLATLCASTHSNCRSRYLGLSLARSAQTDRRRIWSHSRPKFSVSRFSLFGVAVFRRFSGDRDRTTFTGRGGGRFFIAHLA